MLSSKRLLPTLSDAVPLSFFSLILYPWRVFSVLGAGEYGVESIHVTDVLSRFLFVLGSPSPFFRETRDTANNSTYKIGP
jgi:hypothetical protein